MRVLLWVLGLFAAAVALSLMLDAEGYVMVVAPPWRIEASLVFTAALLVLAFVVVYLVVRLLSHALRLPVHVRVFRTRQREVSAQKALSAALQALFEGRYGQVEKLAADAWDRGESRALAALIAARAAHRRRDHEHRDAWLEKAQIEPEWRNARLALQAELLVEDRRYEEARQVLRELHANGARHLGTLNLLLRCEQALGNWDEVVHLAALLEKRAALPAEAVESIFIGARVAQLGRVSHDAASLAEYWRGVPGAERARPRIAAEAARAFARLGDRAAARRTLEEALAASWESELALVYAESADSDALPRIQRAEQWLLEHPRDPLLLLALGRLCLQAELWGKAQSYLEASLAARPSREGHVELAGLFSRIGQTQDADRHFRASADPALGASPAAEAVSVPELVRTGRG
jgi:HemY protein